MVRLSHAAAVLLGWCVSVAESEPLADWLHSLKLSLGDIEQSKFGVTFKASDVVCSELSIGRMQSQLLPVVGNIPGFKLNLQGLGVHCRGHWSLPIGSGDFSADVLPAASASIQVNLPVDENAVPQRTEVSSCHAALQFKVNLGTGITGWMLNTLVNLLNSKIERDVETQVCTGLKEAAAVNGTRAVQTLNKYMLPSSDFNDHIAQAILARRLRPARKVEKGSNALDWSKVQALKLFSSMMKDFVTPSDLNQVLGWATKDTGRFSLNGSSAPLANFSISLSGSSLDVSAGLDYIHVDGVDSVEGFEPISAVSSSDLAGSLSLGTPERPNLEVSTQMWIRIKSSTSESQVSSELLEKAHFKLGLEKPAIDGQLRLLLQEEEWQSPKTLAQWLTTPQGCAQDMLIASPALQDFHVKFANVSEPLTFMAEMEGQLEQDITILINNMVELFNSFYLRFLPAAVARFSSSKQFLENVNAKLTEMVPPGVHNCIEPHAAQAEVEKRFPKLADWRSIFGGEIRQYIDNAADGFIAHNDTRIAKSFSPYNVTTNMADLQIVPSSVHLTGLSAIKKLRVLVPDASDAQLLSNQLSIACPDEKQPWLPAINLAGDIAESSKSYKSTLLAHAQLPCGSVQQSIRAALDTGRALSLQTSLSSLPCIPSAFSDLKLESATGSLQNLGHLIMQMGGRPSEKIVEELCSSYPRLCNRVAKLAKSYQADQINSLLAKLLHASSSLSQCSAPSKETSAAKSVTESDDSGDLTSSPILWGGAFICTAVLMFVATMHVSRCSAARAAAASPSECSMAVACWSSKTRRASASVATLLLILALVLRTVSIFFLDVGHSYAIVKTTDLGPVLRIDLITFTFFGMVEHYWDAGAWIMSGLLLFNSFIVAYGVILLELFIWMVPALKQRRSVLIRVAIFVSRLPLVDVCFFSFIITTLQTTVPMPLGVGNDLQCGAGTAIYVGVVSTFCGMLGAQLLRMEHKWDRTKENSTQYSKTMRGLLGMLAATIFAGMLLCLIVDTLNVNYGGLAGDVLDSSTFSVASLLTKTFTANFVFGFILVVMVITAPLLQASGFILAALPYLALQLPCRWLLEVASAISLLDVFVASLVATAANINLVATWILDNKFGNLCSALSTYADVECINVAPTLAIAGFLGISLAMACSLGISLYWGLMEAKAGNRYAQSHTSVVPASFNSAISLVP